MTNRAEKFSLDYMNTKEELYGLDADQRPRLVLYNERIAEIDDNGNICVLKTTLLRKEALDLIQWINQMYEEN